MKTVLGVRQLLASFFVSRVSDCIKKHLIDISCGLGYMIDSSWCEPQRITRQLFCSVGLSFGCCWWCKHVLIAHVLLLWRIII
jgi:hypothetical protein